MQRCAQTLVDAGNDFDVHTQVCHQAISRLLLVKSLQDGYFTAQLAQPLSGARQKVLRLLAVQMAFYVPARRLVDLERTAKNTLATLQKVGCTTKYRVSPSNHKYLQDTLVTKRTNYSLLR